MKAHTVCFKMAVFSSSVCVCHNVDASEEVSVVAGASAWKLFAVTRWRFRISMLCHNMIWYNF